MVLALVLATVVYGHSQVPPAADQPPASLSQLRDAALAMYASALSDDWTAAPDKLRSIDSAVRDLPATVGKGDLHQQLRGRIRALQDAVRGKQSGPAARNANWIARLADEMASAYETTVPTDVRLLAFFGRQIEVDARDRRTASAKTNLADLRTVWRRVEPLALQRQGTDAARTFSDTLARLDGAATPGDLTDAAHAEVAAADQILALFPHRATAP